MTPHSVPELTVSGKHNFLNNCLRYIQPQIRYVFDAIYKCLSAYMLYVFVGANAYDIDIYLR